MSASRACVCITAVFFLIALIGMGCSGRKQPANQSMQETNESAMGIVEGRVTIGPMCPGPEVAGRPCETPPEIYAAHRVVILSEDAKEVVREVATDDRGNYSVALPPGIYYVDYRPHDIGMSPYTPQQIEVSASETLRHDLEVDTGMR